ncbi:MAG: hypothetical protein ACUVXA_19585 [Candidatus Jordarchaeum sp.]|uniref:hypothetical protein n=1 Tax=Candidatus Jordarchaeum sp. TaxID=2823881 RepID=UPI00404933C5
MSTNNVEPLDVDELIKLVKTNLGRWNANAIFIIDVNFKIWGRKGEIPNPILNFYRKFPFQEMHVGDTLHNENTYMMKVTEKTAVLVRMEDSHIARLSAINLKGRINALSPFYTLDKQVEEKKESKLNEVGKTVKRMW